jgi:hypothetical protein
MTAVIEPTSAEDTILAAAFTALSRVKADTFPWPPRRNGICLSDDLKGTIAGLTASIADFTALRTGRTHPATLFFDLAAGHPDGALAEAMERLAQDIADWTSALDSLADEAEAIARAQGLAA